MRGTTYFHSKAVMEDPEPPSIKKIAKFKNSWSVNARLKHLEAEIKTSGFSGDSGEIDLGLLPVELGEH